MQKLERLSTWRTSMGIWAKAWMRCECEELEWEGRKKNENAIWPWEKSLAIYRKQIDDTHHHN
jgi:hypothetical protein